MKTPDLPGHLARLISSETRFLDTGTPMTLECGATLDRVEIAYQTWGAPENARNRAVLVCHALTGSADVDAWWPGIIGEKGAFDPERDFIICANILGSCYGTTGPVSVDPESGERYRAGFPPITVRDMVRVQRRLVDALGIDRLSLVTGPSLGGMQALEWAAMYPARVDRVAAVGVGGRHSAWCIAASEAQRAAIAADPDWRDGYYTDEAPPDSGLAAARMMAVCGYRSFQSFADRFGRSRKRDASKFDVQSYLRYQGEKFVRRFDANTYVTLTRAMHTHDLARGRGDYERAVEGIHQPVLVVSVSSDALYPPEEQIELAELLPRSRYAVLDSLHGHDGFLIETGRLSRLIADFRREEVPAVPCNLGDVVENAVGKSVGRKRLLVAASEICGSRA